MWRYVVWNCAVVLRVFGVIYSCMSILPRWCVLESHKVRIVFLLKDSLESNVNFSLVIDAVDVHYKFQSEKRDSELSISCQFCWWDIFFRDVCKLQSVVNFDCNFPLLPDATDVHYNFQTKKRVYELTILCQFCWWNIYFLRDVCKLQSVINFDCDFFMLPAAEDVHYYF